MELDDHITITMPEGGELELQLAGLGSRILAGIVDLIIQLILLTGISLLSGVTAHGSRLNAVVFVIGAFVIWFGYPIVFELLARGRTPGKMLVHLRVLRASGAAVDVPSSLIRNLIRVFDGPTLFWLPSIITILATRRNQRPGDLAAGTLVIREQPVKRSPGPLHPGPGATPGPGPGDAHPDWDVSGVSSEEIVTVQRFLERRQTLDRRSREALALRLAEALVDKVPGAAREGSAERFLETLVQVKSERS